MQRNQVKLYSEVFSDPNILTSGSIDEIKRIMRLFPMRLAVGI